MLNAGRCELLDVPRLAAQFAGLERRVARGGEDSIDHAPGGSDDVPNAAAGALVLAGVATAGAARCPWYPGMPEPVPASQPQPEVGRWPP